MIAARRENARKPRPSRATSSTRLSPQEKASLLALKEAVRLRGFHMVAEVMLSDVERYHAQRFGLVQDKPGRRVSRAEFERAAEFLANRCGWSERTTHELELSHLSPITIGRPGFERPSEVVTPTNGHAANGHDGEHATH